MCITFRRYAKCPLRIHGTNKQPTPNILTFGIVCVQNTAGGNSVFVSETLISTSHQKRRQRSEVNVQKRENGLGGFYRMIYRSENFEEYVRRIVDHV